METFGSDELRPSLQDAEAIIDMDCLVKLCLAAPLPKVAVIAAATRLLQILVPRQVTATVESWLQGEESHVKSLAMLHDEPVVYFQRAP